jgi:transposase
MARGERNGSAVLAEGQVKLIRALAAQGLSRSAIAAQFAVAKSTVTFIVNRGTWRHVA